MLVSLNWLKDYVNIDDISPKELAEFITKSGIEVDSIDSKKDSITNLVVGFVKSCEQHPNADKLNLCQVDVGDEVLQIVCGAPNVAAGQKVIVAKPDAKLPGGLKIKRAKLRGIESNGMICSLQELGIDSKFVPKEYAEGIYVFQEDVEVGQDAISLLNLDDTILEFDLTPNRADCLSMLGVAYEVSALLNKELKLPEVNVETNKENAEDYISVKVEDAQLNPYYGAFIIKNVKVGPSPLWMRNRLIAAGIRPINNVVDITNYILLEYGQPLHAFDYDRFGSKEVVVRLAKEGEKIQTLDGEERTLRSSHIVITNGKEPTAIAGVMGGADSEVQDDTTTILLEAAYFNPQYVRTASKDHGLRSEASIRFEKGVDPRRVKEAGLRACELLVKYAGGEVVSGVAEYDHLLVEEAVVSFTTEKINARLGTNISTKEIEDILARLRFPYTVEEDTKFTVNVPTRRGDVKILEDMVEEIARVYGYDKLPYTLPEGSAIAGGLTDKQKLKRKVHRYLQGAGLNEVMTYSLTSEENVHLLVDPTVQALNPKPIKLAMPMSEAHSHLRLSLLPEMIKSIQYNLARQQQSVAIYELGSIYVTDEEVLTKLPMEKLRLTGAITGLWSNHPWQQDVKPVDFYVLKGIVEGLLNELNIASVVYEKASLDNMHPGRTALIKISEKTIGYIGQLHPILQNKYDLTDTYVFDLDFEALVELVHPVEAYETIPKYPSVTQDLAFVVDENTEAYSIIQVIEQAGGEFLQEVSVFDIYQGEHMEQGKKSIAFTLKFQNKEATLTDEEIETARGNIVRAVEEKCSAKLRG
jgi:phenylalanyl-tRNA synthetase beta chain